MTGSSSGSFNHTVGIPAAYRRMSMFEKRRQRKAEVAKQERINIAAEVVAQLESKRGWHKFLPPVSCNGRIYMMTEDGEIYAMGVDRLEQIMKIGKI